MPVESSPQPVLRILTTEFRTRDRSSSGLGGAGGVGTVVVVGTVVEAGVGKELPVAASDSAGLNEQAREEKPKTQIEKRYRKWVPPLIGKRSRNGFLIVLGQGPNKCVNA